MKPNSVPQLGKDGAIAKMNGFDLSGYQVKLLGIRGYYKESMGNPNSNDVGVYDDALFIIAPDFYMSFNANTDPSRQRKGIATLKPGLHLYRKGKHKIASPLGYAALRPANREEKLPVTRDGKDSWGIAINIHKGSLTNTSSEGCQTIYPTQWEDFIHHVYRLMKVYNQDIIPYVLIENK